MKVSIIISGDTIKNYETNELLNLINSHHQIINVFSENIIKREKNKFINILKSIFANKLFYLIFLEQKIAHLTKNNSSYLLKLKQSKYSEYSLIFEDGCKQISIFILNKMDNS